MSQADIVRAYVEAKEDAERDDASDDLLAAANIGLCNQTAEEIADLIIAGCPEKAFNLSTALFGKSLRSVQIVQEFFFDQLHFKFIIDPLAPWQPVVTSPFNTHGSGKPDTNYR